MHLTATCAPYAVAFEIINANDVRSPRGKAIESQVRLMSAKHVEDGNEVDIPRMVHVAFGVPHDLFEGTVEVRHVEREVLWFLSFQKVLLSQGSFVIL